MNDLFNLRFIIPPIISITSFLILQPEYLDKIFNYLAKYGSGQAFFGVVGSYFFVLALGFVISSMANVIVKLMGWNETIFEDATLCYDKGRIHDYKEIYIWANLIGVNKEDNTPDGKLREYIEKHITKRWDISLISFNAAVGIVLAFSIYCLYVLRNHGTAHNYSVLVIVLLFVIFLCNANYTRKSHNFLKLIMTVFDRDFTKDDHEFFRREIARALQKKFVSKDSVK